MNIQQQASLYDNIIEYEEYKRLISSYRNPKDKLLEFLKIDSLHKQEVFEKILKALTDLKSDKSNPVIGSSPFLPKDTVKPSGGRSKLSKFLKKAGIVGTVLTTAYAANEIAESDLPVAEKVAESAKLATRTAGSVLGGVIGGAAGVVGGPPGIIFGNVAGSMAGEELADKLITAIEGLDIQNVINSITESPAVKNIVDSVPVVKNIVQNIVKEQGLPALAKSENLLNSLPENKLLIESIDGLTAGLSSYTNKLVLGAVDIYKTAQDSAKDIADSVEHQIDRLQDKTINVIGSVSSSLVTPAKSIYGSAVNSVSRLIEKGSTVLGGAKEYVQERAEEYTNSSMGRASNLANLIASHESKGDYNISNKGVGHKYKQDHTNLANLTVDQVMGLQALPKQHENKLFAVGKYQVIPETMKAARKALGLKGDEKFDSNLQERIFTDYLANKAGISSYLKGEIDANAAVKRGAQEWASIGLLEGQTNAKGIPSAAGKSYYAGDGVNVAATSPIMYRLMLKEAKQRYDEAIRKGVPEKQAQRQALLNNQQELAGTSEGLRLKGNQAIAGGNTKKETFGLAHVLQDSIPGLKQFTALDDSYHHSEAYKNKKKRAGKSTHSSHVDGRALDFTLNNPVEADIVSKQVRTKLAEMGVQGKVINEYANLSSGGTGGHIHVELAKEPKMKVKKEYQPDIAMPKEKPTQIPNTGVAQNTKAAEASISQITPSVPQALPAITMNNAGLDSIPLRIDDAGLLLLNINLL